MTDTRHDWVQIPDTLYEASPGASTWTQATDVPQLVYLQTVQWDANGRPKALWAQLASDSQGTAWYLVSHPL